jgi:hypothetical protein
MTKLPVSALSRPADAGTDGCLLRLRFNTGLGQLHASIDGVHGVSLQA